MVPKHMPSQNVKKKMETWMALKIYFNHGQSNSRGLMTILPGNLDCKVYKVLTDNNRRILILCIDIDGEKLCVV